MSAIIGARESEEPRLIEALSKRLRLGQKHNFLKVLFGSQVPKSREEIEGEWNFQCGELEDDDIRNLKDTFSSSYPRLREDILKILSGHPFDIPMPSSVPVDGSDLDKLVVAMNAILFKVGQLKEKVDRVMDHELVNVWAVASSDYAYSDVGSVVELRGGQKCELTGHTLDDAPKGWVSRNESDSYIKAAHLYPRSITVRDKIGDLFGRSARYPGDFRINSPRNIIMLRHDLELAFDQNLFVFMPVSLHYDRYRVVQVHADADSVVRDLKVNRDKVFEWSSFCLGLADVANATLSVPRQELRPYRRVLGYHMKITAQAARNRGFPLCEGIDLDTLIARGEMMMESSRLGTPEPIVEDDICVTARRRCALNQWLQADMFGMGFLPDEKQE